MLRMLQNWKHAKKEEEEAKARIEMTANQDDDARRLMTIPGIGPMNANLMKAHIGDPHRFRDSRQAAASIGFVPRQYSTGGRDTLLHISKRGPSALRSCLVQGASSFYIMAERLKGNPGTWVRKIKSSGKKYGVIICAIAAKLARICWRILLDKTDYSPNRPNLQQAKQNNGEFRTNPAKDYAGE